MFDSTRRETRIRVAVSLIFNLILLLYQLCAGLVGSTHYRHPRLRGMKFGISEDRSELSALAQ